VAAAAAAAGVTAPVWVTAGAMLLGAAAAAAIANQIWPPDPGDGTEGSPQAPVAEVLPAPGQPGQVAGAFYNVAISWTAQRELVEGGAYPSGEVGVFAEGRRGPITVFLESGQMTYLGNSKPHKRYGFIDGDGAKFGGLFLNPITGQIADVGVSGLQKFITRMDGTSVEQDIAQGSAPNIPGVAPTYITQNISTGGTTININQPPQPGKTPTAPPPVAPPKPAKPTPTGTGGSNSPSPSPSPQPQPAPAPTTTPSAPTTSSGNPSNNAPTTGPRPSPGGSNQSGGQSGSGQTGGGAAKPLTDPGQIAALIAGTSPGVAGIIGAINNSAQPKQPTPTGAPIKLPDNNSPTTGPDNRPPGQGDPEVRPGQPQPITNERGETVGTKTEVKDQNGNITYTITQTTNNTTVNNVANQIDQSTTQNNTLIQNIVNQITNPTPPPTNVTTVNNVTQTEQITNNIQNTINNQTNQINQNTTNIVNNSTTNITETINNTTNNQLTQLLEKSDVDLASTLAILATLATAVALEQSKNQTLTAIGNIPTPTPCAYPAYHPQNQAERAAIGGKVDGVNTVLGTVTNVQIAEAKTGITNVASLIGSPVAGGAQTVLGGINATQTWLGKFAKSLYLDKIYNGLTLLVTLHNAAMLSRNLAETIGFFIDSGLQALNLKKEDEEPLDLGAQLGKTIENFIKDIVGDDIYNSLSTNWKKASAIYSSAVNILDSLTSMLAGLAESMEIIGNYTGKIGNALKKGGVVLENAYDWMDDNLRLKTGRFAGIQKVVDGINNAEEVVNNLTEVTDSINESQELVNEIKKEWKDIKDKVTEGEGQKLTIETQNKVASQGAPVSKPDLITPED
jgi:hypothetical protein